MTFKRAFLLAIALGAICYGGALYLANTTVIHWLWLGIALTSFNVWIAWFLSRASYRDIFGNA